MYLYVRARSAGYTMVRCDSCGQTIKFPGHVSEYRASEVLRKFNWTISKGTSQGERCPQCAREHLAKVKGIKNIKLEVNIEYERD